MTFPEYSIPYIILLYYTYFKIMNICIAYIMSFVLHISVPPIPVSRNGRGVDLKKVLSQALNPYGRKLYIFFTLFLYKVEC